MANPSDIQYRMKCTVCSGAFLVDKISSRIPSHPQKGRVEGSDRPFVPCAGSSKGGIVAGTVMRS
jgi:hypothetical protein